MFLIIKRFILIIFFKFLWDCNFVNLNKIYFYGKRNYFLVGI